MSPHQHPAVTSRWCGLCDGPCREPSSVGPVPENYPFMSQAHIEAVNRQEPPSTLPARRRRDEDRMRRHTEDR